MKTLLDIHELAAAELTNHFSLSPVALKHPFPERPVRTLGLIKMDGEVYTSEKLLRVVCLRITLPVFFKVFSTFIRPKLEYDLPVLSCEVVCMGGKRMFILDVHYAGSRDASQQDELFFDNLYAIKQTFPDLLEHQTKKMTGNLQGVFSKAMCQVNITRDLDERALQMFRQYLDAYAQLVGATEPLTGDTLDGVRKQFEAYLETIIEHDPGVKGNKIFFGEKGGVERALDIFYGM